MNRTGSIPILRVADTLLVSLQLELRDTVAQALQEDVLNAIAETGETGLLIDVTGLETVDSYVARMLVETARMARLMGTDTVVVGIRPEVAATLVRMGLSTGGLKTALNVNEGLMLLGREIRNTTRGS